MVATTPSLTCHSDPAAHPGSSTCPYWAALGKGLHPSGPQSPCLINGALTVLMGTALLKVCILCRIPCKA